VKRGFELFKGKARCDLCHSGFNFTDDGFHNIGLKGNTDIGRFNKVPVRVMRGAFKTPTLRDVALTAPYMHDGRYRTLEEVIDHYDRGGDTFNNLDPQMQQLGLSAEEKADLVAFLKSLTGSARQVVIPNLPSRVSSGPGGLVTSGNAPGEPAPQGQQSDAAENGVDTPVVNVVEEVAPGTEKMDVYQMDKAFFQNSKRIVALKVRTGEAVRFHNNDKLSHNLYSVSTSKTFDLGLLRKNETRSILFDRRGEVEIQCAIHPEMLLVVDVQ
jgi:plastocyanin